MKARQGLHGAGEIMENRNSGERFHWRQTTAQTRGRSISFELEIAPGGAVPGAHRHPGAAERFEVLTGQIALRTGTQVRVLRSGQVTVPAGPRTRGGTPATVRRASSWSSSRRCLWKACSAARSPSSKPAEPTARAGPTRWPSRHCSTSSPTRSRWRTPHSTARSERSRRSPAYSATDRSATGTGSPASCPRPASAGRPALPRPRDDRHTPMPSAPRGHFRPPRPGHPRRRRARRGRPRRRVQPRLDQESLSRGLAVDPPCGVGRTAIETLGDRRRRSGDHLAPLVALRGSSAAPDEMPRANSARPTLLTMTTPAGLDGYFRS
jgi:mannose-6-phosphate isomerase-like protein (cupin superfamily)